MQGIYNSFEELYKHLFQNGPIYNIQLSRTTLTVRELHYNVHENFIYASLYSWKTP